jgi:hypothetical protein
VKVISDTWNHSVPRFGEVNSSDLDYRVFLQDEKWPQDGLFQDLATMTPDELFKALEELYCGAERHYKGMLQWYEDQYRYLLTSNLATGSLFLGFLVDYQSVMNKNPHQWLRDSILGQGFKERLETMETN